MSENQQELGFTQANVNTPQICATPREKSRFWCKVNKNGPMHSTKPHLGNCWLWTAGKWGRGYGAFTFRNGQIKSHRFSYLTEVGPIPTEKPFVLHSCDVRLCCNPSHLFLGTYADNAADMCSKGRQSVMCGANHYYNTHPEKIRKGTMLTQSKLTEAIVTQVLSTDFSVRGSKAALAEALGVSPGTISMILSGKTWKHVKQTPHGPSAQ